MKKLLRGAFVIGRRDFSATVLSKTFLFFLLGPLFPLLFGLVFGGIGASVANSRVKPAVAVVAAEQDFASLEAARDRLAAAIDEDHVVRLVRVDPEPDANAQRVRLLTSHDQPVQAVLTGWPDHPQLTGTIRPDGTVAGQLRLFFADVRNDARPELTVAHTDTSAASTSRDQALTGQAAQTALFFFTLLLSTMLLSQLVEEKSNKIIEVVAAAVPIESLFVGKLFAMLAASILGIVVWTATGAVIVASLKAGGLASLPAPAVGWATFLTLTAIYFAMNYLLFGAVFLTIGAQASTVREVQTLSMPVTFGQVLIFGFAATAVSAPTSNMAFAAAIFPLSSPLTMVARAAEQPGLGQHVIAIAWQALWVAIILRTGAIMFRKTVLKSGPRTRWRLGRA